MHKIIAIFRLERVCRLKWFGVRFLHSVKLEVQRWIWSVFYEVLFVHFLIFGWGLAELIEVELEFLIWLKLLHNGNELISFLFYFSDLLGCHWSARVAQFFIFGERLLFLETRIDLLFILNLSFYFLFYLIFLLMDLATWLNSMGDLLFMPRMPVCLLTYCCTCVLISIYEIMV